MISGDSGVGWIAWSPMASIEQSPVTRRMILKAVFNIGPLSYFRSGVRRYPEKDKWPNIKNRLEYAGGE